MLKPAIENLKDFEKFGFKKCNGFAGKNNMYYLCVPKSAKMLFVNKNSFMIEDWNREDVRIHNPLDCNFNDNRDYMDIIYDLIMAKFLEKKNEIKEESWEMCDWEKFMKSKDIAIHFKTKEEIKEFIKAAKTHNLNVSIENVWEEYGEDACFSKGYGNLEYYLDKEYKILEWSKIRN